MDQVLQESVEIGHVSNPKWLEQPENDPEESMTFHSGEQNELEDVTKNTKSKIVQPTRNHPLELWRIKIEAEIPWEPIWDLIKKTKSVPCDRC
jgi:hypothetical protein